MQEIKTYFGKNLKRIRKQKGFTQEILAENTGIDRRQITRIETGKSFPSLETLDSLCAALNIAPQKLFDFSEFTVTNNNSNEKAVKKDNKIFNEIKSKITEYENQTQKIKFIKLAIDCLEDKKSILKMQNVLEGMLL